MSNKVYGAMATAILAGLIAGCSATGTSQPQAFTDWPAGASPLEVGKKLSNHMVPLWQIRRPSVHYAQDSAWMTALKFAAMTQDEDLKTRLIRKFDPILEPEGRRVISMQRHVDHTIFGIVPLEIYMQTKDPRYLEIGKMLADRQ